MARLLRLGALLALTAGLGTGCRLGGGSPRAVVLITLDTVRADHIGAYLAGRPDSARPPHVETPNLDRLAESGFLFQNALTPVPLTSPAHTTMMTGLYPQAHGVTSNETTQAGSDLPLLALDFKSAGYTTAAFVSSFVLSAHCGLARGFDHYADLPAGERRAGPTTDEVLRWLKGRPGKERLFLWVHYYDAHAPYDPPADIRGFEDSPYDGEIAYVDRELGRLLRGLRELGWDQKAVIVIAGDHGEGLLDHGEREHGMFLYEETVRVPLLIRAPQRDARRTGASGGRVAEVVSLVDLRPTLAGLAGIKLQGEAPQGKDLRPLLKGRGSRSSGHGTGADPDARVVLMETMYPEAALGWSRLQGLRGPRWKYIQAPIAELYDLAADPKERHNLAGTEPDTLHRYGRLFGKLQRESSRTRESAVARGVNPETARLIRSLGYLAPSPLPSNAEALPDPKTMIGLYQDLEAAKLHVEQEEWAPAYEATRRVLAKAPDSFVALFYAATALAGLGRQEESNALYEGILKRDPGNSKAHLCLAENLVQLGRYDEAIPHLNQARENATLRAPAQWLLTTVFEARDELGAAYENARAITGDPELGDQALRKMGLLSIQLGEMERARQEITRALSLFPQDAELHMGLALAQAAVPGQEAEAEKELRRAIELSPAEPVCHYNLACILARTGRGAEAMAELKQAVRLGYANREQMRRDPDLASIRGLPDFRPLLEQVSPGRGAAGRSPASSGPGRANPGGGDSGP